MEVKGEALVWVVLSVGLDESVVEEKGGFGGLVEGGMGIVKVWDFKELLNEDFGVVYAISQSVGMDLLHLVHHSFFMGGLETALPQKLEI